MKSVTPGSVPPNKMALVALALLAVSPVCLPAQEPESTIESQGQE